MKKGTSTVTTQVFGEENPTPCTLVIVPGSVAIMYITHYRIISFSYNEIRVQNRIFTSETTRCTNLVQAPWAKRQVEIPRSGSEGFMSSSSIFSTGILERSNATLPSQIPQTRTLTPSPILHTHKIIPKEWDRFTSPTICSFKWLNSKR
jgi:hypothetical protein